jgi:hypothetical protein
MIVRYYKFSYAICGRTFRSSISPFELGSGLRRWPNCTSVFPDTSQEWPELTALERFEYVCPVMVLEYFEVATVTLAVVIPQLADGNETWLTIGVVAPVMKLPWALIYFVGRTRLGNRKKDSIAAANWKTESRSLSQSHSKFQ